MVKQAALFLLPGLAAALPAVGQTSRLWRPEERVVLPDLRFVGAVAADDTYLFIASRHALGLYDRRMMRWLPPVTRVDGYPTAAVTIALADPSDRSIWLGTREGLFNYSPLLQQVRRISIVGGVRMLMLDAANPVGGLFVRTATGWELLPAGGTATFPATNLPSRQNRIMPLSIEQMIRSLPMLEGMRSVVLTDDRLRTYRYTAAARVPHSEEVLLGTDGLGAILVDPLTATFTRMDFGLMGQGAGAVTVVPGGVWVGALRDSERRGFTFVSDDLQRFEYDEGPRVTGFGLRSVRSIVMRASGLWAATDAGIVWVRPGGDVRRIDIELPLAESYALAPSDSGLWVGTAGGLAFVDDFGVVSHVAGALGRPVFAVSATEDSVWFGTSDGLVVYSTHSRELLVPALIASEPQLLDPIIATALVGDTLVVATQQRVLWRAPDGAWQNEGRIVSNIGLLRKLAPDSGGVWIGGDQGFAFFRFAFREFTFFNARGDIPGRVQDMAVSNEYLWIATEGGLVRFSKRALL